MSFANGSRVRISATTYARLVVNRALRVGVGAVQLVLLGCPERVPQEYRGFMYLPADRQAAALREYPVDMQVKLYLYHMDHAHPQNRALVKALAANGKSAVPFLIPELDSGRGPMSLYHVLLVFKDMSVFDYYHLEKDSKVGEAVEHAVSAVRDPFWQCMCRNALRVAVEPRSADTQQHCSP